MNLNNQNIKFILKEDKITHQDILIIDMKIMMIIDLAKKLKKKWKL
jgi:hypothetical protein